MTVRSRSETAIAVHKPVGPRGDHPASASRRPGRPRIRIFGAREASHPHPRPAGCASHPQPEVLKIACLKPSKTKIFFGLALGAKRRARRPPMFEIDHYAPKLAKFSSGSRLALHAALAGRRV